MARLAALLFFALCVPAACAQEKSGNLTVTIRFLGTVPPPQRVMTTDGGVLFHNDLVVDAKSKGLRYVVATLHDVPLPAKEPKSASVVIDQRDMLFQPRVVAVLAGQTVRFENNDLCNHAVQATSIDPSNVFNIVTPQGSPFEYKFKNQKRPVMIGCPIHPWMRAWIHVLPHPYFAVSDADGRFRIVDIPPGQFTLSLVHPDTRHQETRKVTIASGQTTSLQIDWLKVVP